MADTGVADIAEQFEQMTIIKNEEIAKLHEEIAKLKKQLKEKEEEDEEQVNEKEEEDEEQLLARLKKKLADTGLSQNVVAEQIGVVERTICKWLSGTGNTHISKKNCKKLAEWLDAEVTGWTTERKTALIAKLQKTLNDKGISQTTAAKELDIQNSTLTNWFKHERDMAYKQCDKIHRWIQDKEKTV